MGGAFNQCIFLQIKPRLARRHNVKRFYWHDVSVMGRWHDDDRIITIQPMVICFSWEKQVSVAPKDVYRPSIFSSPTATPLHWQSINPLQFILYHPGSTDFEEKIEGLWTGYQHWHLNISQMAISRGWGQRKRANASPPVIIPYQQCCNFTLTSDGLSCVFFSNKEMHGRGILQNAKCRMPNDSEV